jgi:uncharacterized protein DUF3833
MQAAQEPLNLRHVFAQPWEGEGDVSYVRWLRWLPAPRKFRFRSEIANVAGDSWEVIDTTTFPDGSVERRVMRARQVEDDRVELVADDMPGGARLRVRSDGLDFGPYVIRMPVLGRLRLPVRHRDTLHLIGDGEMVDTIELSVFGLRVACVTIRLERCTRAAR